MIDANIMEPPKYVKTSWNHMQDQNMKQFHPTWPDSNLFKTLRFTPITNKKTNMYNADLQELCRDIQDWFSVAHAVASQAQEC